MNVCVVVQHTDKMMAFGKGWEKLFVSRDTHATALVDPCGGDFTRTTGAVSERRAIG